MKTWGYVLALTVGLAIGWLGQQFWAVDHDKSGASAVELQRSTERLKKLQSEKVQLAPVRADQNVAVDQSNSFKDRVLNEGVESSYFWLSQQEMPFARYFERIKILVDSLLRQDKFAQAIDMLYEQRLSIPYEHEEVFQSYIYEIVDKIELELIDISAIGALVQIYQLLVSLEPDYVPYTLSLVHWLIQTKDFDRAEQQLSVARNDIEYKNAADELAQEIEDMREIESGGAVAIPLVRKGKHFIAQVALEQGQSVDLLLDTGATLTVLKDSIAANLGLDQLSGETIRMATANGTVQGYKVVVPELTMPGVRLSDVEVGLIPLPGVEFDGLLGMNVLGRFKFFIDQEQQVLLLKK